MDSVPPKFLSIEFHARFLPRLLLDRYRRRGTGEARGTTFVAATEMYVLLAACLVLVAAGLPPALERGSAAGWILGGAGAAGTVVLLVSSVAGYRGRRPDYDGFLGGVFFLCVSLGAVSGIPVGMHARSPGAGILAGLAGLAAGYALGILAGLRLQHLGWAATVLNLLAGLGALAVAAVGLVVLLVAAT